MNPYHPVIPPAYMLQAWRKQHKEYGTTLTQILIKAAQYGADIELEECCKLFQSNSVCGTKFQRESSVTALRNKRRPKPKQTTLTVSITGTEDELNEFISKFKDDRKISIQL